MHTAHIQPLIEHISDTAIIIMTGARERHGDSWKEKKEKGGKKTFINDPYAHLSTFTFRHGAAAATVA